MKSLQDVQHAASAFMQAHPHIGPSAPSIPMSKRQARDEMQGLTRYPARWVAADRSEPADECLAGLSMLLVVAGGCAPGVPLQCKTLCMLPQLGQACGHARLPDP